MAKRLRAATAELSFLSVKDLSGGIDLRRAPSLVAAHRSRVCRNWAIDEPGVLKVYPGWDEWLTTSLGSNRMQGGRRVYLSGVTPFVLAAYGGDIYKPNDAGVAGAAVLTGRHATNEIDIVYDADLVAVFDGSNTPKKSTDGTTWTNFGIAAPLAAPTAALVAGGSLVNGNEYEFSFSGKDDELGHEGNESATVTQTTSPGNLTIRLTIPKHPDTQVDTLVVYGRDVTAGEQVRRKVGTVANPGGASTTFDVTANNWEDEDEAPTDHDVALALKFATPWKNRWWGVIGRSLYFSQIFQPQSWPALFFIEMPFEKGDEITAIQPQGDTLVVFGAKSKPFLVIGQTSLDFEVRPAFGAQSGAVGFRAVQAIENGVIHGATDGVYIFDGATDRLLSDDVDPGWQAMVQAAANADLQRIAICYDSPRKFVHVAVPYLFPFATAGEWILDLHRTRQSEEAAWTTTDRTIGGYIPFDGPETTSGNHGRLLSWSDTIGRLYEECVGTTANGADMVADYTGPTFAVGVQAIFTELYGEYRPSAGAFTVEVLVDGQSGGSNTIDIDDALSIYGVAEYGVDGYGGPDRRSFPLMLPMSAEGLTSYVKLRYTGQEQFAFYTYQMAVTPEPLPRSL